MNKPVDLSIIILNYNTKELTRLCLDSLANANQKGAPWEVIVVDNGSTDGSLEDLNKRNDIHVIKLSENRGFAAGNNVGIKKAVGKYILLLNSDTEVSKGTIETMLDFMEMYPDTGVATCKLLLPNGLIDPACHRGFPTPWAALTYFVGFEKLFPKSRLFGSYHQGYKDMDAMHDIDSPSGAFFLVRSEVIKCVGLLDEDYFMYGEDLDWAYRIKKAGWRIVYNPAVSILHKKKRSGRVNKDRTLRMQTQIYFYETMLLFYKKHLNHRYSPLLMVLIFVLLKIRIFTLRLFLI